MNNSMNPSNPIILAVGAAGHFAGLVVPELAKRGAKVRALIRHAEQSEAVTRNGAAEVALGDLSDRASLDAVLTGVDSVFYIAPLGVPNEAEIGQGLVAAAKRAGVRRIVFSALIHPILRALPHHIAKAPVEEAILASDMEFTFLHPTVFFQNIAEAWPGVTQTGVYTEPWSPDSRFSRVDFRDVAEVASIALFEDRLLYGTFELCARGHLNRHDVAALMSDVLKRPVKAGSIDKGTAPAPANSAEAAKTSEQMAELQPMVDWYDRHGMVGKALILSTILGREPRTLSSYFEELARPTH